MDEKLDALNRQLKDGKPIIKDFRDYFEELSKKQKKFQGYLEYAVQMKKDQKEFENLYKKITGKNASNLVDSLTRTGNWYKKNLNKDSFSKAFENMGYRLLEQTRAGKRDDVYYGILRIFVTNKIKFPDDLVEAFKPIYSNEMFKVFIFSFLSGIIGKEQQNENK